ncbi:MAG: Yip1 family protein [Paracoccaceae bacterium]
MLDKLLALLRLTLADPARAARALLSKTPPAGGAIEFAALVVLLGTIFSVVTAPLFGDPVIGLVAGLIRNPVMFAIVDLMTLLMTAIVIHVVGNMFGGRGRFEQAVFLVAWLQVPMLVFQAGLAVLVLVSPVLADMGTILANFYVVWLLANFIAVLHGFASVWKVIAGILLTGFALAFALGLLLAFLGIAGQSV